VKLRPSVSLNMLFIMGMGVGGACGQGSDLNTLIHEAAQAAMNTNMANAKAASERLQQEQSEAAKQSQEQEFGRVEVTPGATIGLGYSNGAGLSKGGPTVNVKIQTDRPEDSNKSETEDSKPEHDFSHDAGS
jgi:hypothetical protein